MFLFQSATNVHLWLLNVRGFCPAGWHRRLDQELS